MAFFASEFDAAEGAVAKHVAADADVRLVLFFVASGGDFKILLKFVLLVRTDANARSICLSLVALQRTKDGSSLSMTRKSCVMATTGLNLAGAVGVGKNARNTRSYSLVTKFFVTGVAGASAEAVRAV